MKLNLIEKEFDMNIGLVDGYWNWCLMNIGCDRIFDTFNSSCNLRVELVQLWISNEKKHNVKVKGF